MFLAGGGEERPTSQGGGFGLRRSPDIAIHAHMASWALTSKLINGVTQLAGFAADVDTIRYGNLEAKPRWVAELHAVWEAVGNSISPDHEVRYEIPFQHSPQSPFMHSRPNWSKPLTRFATPISAAT